MRNCYSCLRLWRQGCETSKLDFLVGVAGLCAQLRRCVAVMAGCISCRSGLECPRVPQCAPRGTLRTPTRTYTRIYLKTGQTWPGCEFDGELSRLAALELVNRWNRQHAGLWHYHLED
jgi:hypothetical protein